MKITPDTRIEIDNFKYFNMIDNQIRRSMAKFELSYGLDWCNIILAKSEISYDELAEYPIEGYYYKSPLLKWYFTIIRNLQNNEEIYDRVASCEELSYLKALTDNNLFGTESSTEYKKLNKKEPILKRRYDIMCLALKETGETSNLTRPWDVKTIMDTLLGKYTGNENIVELAFLTQDPRCLCCACETNALYREVIAVSGCFYGQPTYRWNVSKEVEDMGKRLIASYNNLIKSDMVAPSIYNCEKLNMEAESPRVALLGQVLLTGENYYWVLDRQGEFLEFYSREMLTTENYQKIASEKD